MMTNKQNVNSSQNSALAGLGQALDQGAWVNLYKSNPVLAQAVADAVGQGVTPIAIRHYVMRHTGGQSDLAKFVEQAARWVAKAAPDET